MPAGQHMWLLAALSAVEPVLVAEQHRKLLGRVDHVDGWSNVAQRWLCVLLCSCLLAPHCRLGA